MISINRTAIPARLNMDSKKKSIGCLLFLLSVSLLGSQFSHAVYNITSSVPLPNGQTLSSPGGVYELGFFNPNNSQNQYLGIWYKNFTPRIVVWVANRETPVTDSPANLRISNNGNIILLDGRNKVVWSSKTNFTSNSSLAELLDDGNFVLKDVLSGSYLWESFNYPGNTQLPNSKLSYNLKTGEKKVLTSWTSDNDPSPGNYVVELVPQLPPQVFIWKGSLPYWRTGPWTKIKFTGVPNMDASYQNPITIEQDVEKGTGYVTLIKLKIFEFAYVFISPEGSVKFLRNEGDIWHLDWEAPAKPCDFYGACGPFGICIESETRKCECLQGFVPKLEKEWKKGNWTGGCVRQTELLCEKNASALSMQSKNQDMFYQVVRTKLPDLYESVFASDAQACHQECLSNCSCSAYAFIDGIGCLVWKQELVDVVKFSSGGEDLFIRLAHSEFGHKKRTKMLIASLTVTSIIIILGAVLYGFCRWRKAKENATYARSNDTRQESSWRSDLKQKDIADLHFFDFHTILVATDNFSMSNKLGQGGFGPVYKGKLQDGNEIAVKRLSSSSGQGIKEFKNEIILISKLQHRNLVRLLGCCVEKEEKMLVYEFLANKSLDSFLFDPTKKLELNWAKRFNIIQGIARGLLYLHRDSCLRVIHRDLKVSNILLDGNMEPKISDFGLARMFEGTRDLANTRRVVGTIGYMSPEYALGGIVSEKSDVFSFGILLLEIISGRKTTSFNYDEQSLSLVTYVTTKSKPYFILRHNY